MEGKRFIKTLRLENFLSFGSEGEEIELQPLNVLVGANNSGKSNLIEAFGVLRATPLDLSAYFRLNGGVSQFLYKGAKMSNCARIKAIVDYSEGLQDLSYELIFKSTQGRLQLVDEIVENVSANTVKNSIVFEASFENDRYLDSIETPPIVELSQSILSKKKDPVRHPKLSYLGSNFYNTKFYRQLPMGRYSEPNNDSKANSNGYSILENRSNLGLVLNNLQYRIGTQKVIETLQKFHTTALELIINISEGTGKIFIREKGFAQPFSEDRLSDGTLRYLFLMALLLDPTPPPLICIEEPEKGFHPDTHPIIAEMLVEASQRTQLIITTNSDFLVSALSEYPESLIVCERDEKGSNLKHLDLDSVEESLKHYSLGDLWRMGEIGGN